jgi:hypothetical protein
MYQSEKNEWFENKERLFMKQRGGEEDMVGLTSGLFLLSLFAGGQQHLVTLFASPPCRQANV